MSRTAGAAEGEPKSEGPVRAVTIRSVVTSIILLPINAYWLVQMEVVRYSAHPTTVSLFFNLIFILLVLTVLNRLVASRFPRLSMSRAELLFIYSVLAIGSCLCGHDMFQVLVPTLSWPYYFADSANNWHSLFIDKYLPSFAVMGDPKVLRGYYVGNDTLYRWHYIRAWTPVVLFWTAFVGALLFVMQ